ncbi:hypothetical protein BJX62DRAFT_237633 [Aspergillus germanicus]
MWIRFTSWKHQTSCKPETTYGPAAFHPLCLTLALVALFKPAASTSDYYLQRLSRDVESPNANFASLIAVSGPITLWKRRRGGGGSSSSDSNDSDDSDDTEDSQNDDNYSNEDYNPFADFEVYVDPRTNMSGDCPNIRSDENYAQGYVNGDAIGASDTRYEFNGEWYTTCPREWWRGDGCFLGSTAWGTPIADDEEDDSETEAESSLDPSWFPGGRRYESVFLADYDPASSVWGEIHSTNSCLSKTPCCVSERPAVRLPRVELEAVFPGNWGADVTYAWLFNYTRNGVWVVDSVGQEMMIGIRAYLGGIEKEIEKNDANRNAALKVVEFEGEVVMRSSSRDNLAIAIICALILEAEAVEIYQRALAGYEKALGSGHKKTRMVSESLASLATFGAEHLSKWNTLYKIFHRK